MPVMQWNVLCATMLCLLRGGEAQATPIKPVANSTEAPYVIATANDSVTTSVHNMPKCKLIPTSDYILNVLADSESAKLLEYELVFENYTVNPLLEQSIRENYKANIWQKAATKHGRTLVTMNFNYDVLSLSVLSLGVEKHTVVLKDEPVGCFGELTEMDRMDNVLWLLSRDFNSESASPTIARDDYICHQVFHTSSSTARFVDKCCRVDLHQSMACSIERKSLTLSVLLYCVIALKIAVFLLVPYLIPCAVYMFSKGADTFRVILKSSLRKTMLVASDPGNVKFDHHWPAEALDNFDKFQETVKTLQKGKPVKVKLSEYFLSVETDHVVTENRIPVGLFACVKYRVLQCGMRKLWACAKCCNASICGVLNETFPIKWKHIGYATSGLILVTLVFPFPYWLRLIFFNVFEREELSSRSEFANRFGFNKAYELHLVQYFFPENAIFIVCYVMYGILILLQLFFKIEPSGRYRNIIKSSFVDMHNVPIVTIIGKMVEFLLLPCRFLGCLGFIVSFIFWPIAVPICLVLFILSCAPLLYLTYRFFMHIYTSVSSSYSKLPKNTSVYSDTTETDMLSDTEPSTKTMGCMDKALCIILPIMYLFGIWCTVFLVSECLGFGLEVLIFTLIGLIVNAGSVLKYLSILLLLIIYSYDCFHNVYLKYLSLNKAIFKDVSGRVKDDVIAVSQLPSRLQENRGFKAEALTEQDKHERPDRLSRRRPIHWNVNDLVLFVNKFDLHFVPVKLFYAITMIEVAGAPGPVYKSMVHAWRRFGQIVIFLCFLVMTVSIFGSIYNIGSTSQMLATLAGGIFPFILRNFMSSKADPIELNSCTFKCKVDEVIENFKEDWPIADLPFEVDEDQSGVESCEKVDLFIQLPKSGIRSNKHVLINMGWRGKRYSLENTEDVDVKENIRAEMANEGDYEIKVKEDEIIGDEKV
ncbi:unnamed protein product [Owenia fusiformis]|uniref:Uncharacterized protein n=1 Tax=Owenia fusiformis TaxID=6347 RepID=A0A8J1XIU5_OWEFU|nr:unnamed protein product [Owenia fusiformis]